MWEPGSAPPRPGEALVTTPRATLVLAPNANPWTFEGTNTWVVGEPGDPACAVVDPGPDDDAHLEAVLAAVGGRAITGVWVTHAHLDHAELAPRLARLAGVPLSAANPRIADAQLGEGDRLRAGALQAQVLHTPGHTGDSLCFLLPDEATLLTGDTVLGRGAPVVRPGRLGEMLATLTRLQRVAAVPGATVLPGHGPTLADPLPELERRLAARLRRVEQVAAAMAAGIEEPAALVDHLYPELDPALRRAAEASVAAAVLHVQQQPGGRAGRLVGR